MLGLKSMEKRSTPKRDLDFFLGFFLSFGWPSALSSVSSCVVSSLKSLSTPDEPDGAETSEHLEERELLENAESLEEEDTSTNLIKAIQNWID